MVRWKLAPKTLELLHQAWRRLSERAGRPLSRDEGLQQMAQVVLGSSAAVVETGHMASVGQIEKNWSLAKARTDLVEHRSTGPTLGQNFVEQSSGRESLAAGPSADFEGSQAARSRVRFNPVSRTVTEAQRRELMRRDRFRCSTPGCENRLWLQVHHVNFYCRRGPTLPRNLVVLCSACHRLIHAGGLVVAGEPPGKLVFSDRDGNRLDEFVPYELRPG
jgi:hypothetical protein